MVRQQRRVAEVSTDRGGVVMVGRDIGTVVLPDADLKIFLDASVEERARRRWAEERARGKDSDYEAVLASTRRRDQIDSSRDVSPLQAAEDAVVLDSTNLSIKEVVVEMERLIEGRRCRAA
jgi:cytidylate kinase